jgi:hypothetical protein
LSFEILLLIYLIFFINFRTQTGASIIITTKQTATILTISGDSSQLRKAKVSIRDFLEKNSFAPTVYYYILDRSVSKNNNELKFVKFNEEIIEISDDVDDDGGDDDDSLEDSDRKNRYYVEFLQQNNETDDDDDDTHEPEEYPISPCNFNTFDKIDECLERLYLKIKTTIKRSLAFPDQIIFEPKIFFGKILFSDVINPEDTFVLQEWYRFVLSKHGGRESIDDYSFEGDLYNNKTVNTEFQQDSPLIKEKFKILQQKFGFELDKEQIINKGKICIYYNPTEFKKRKITLRWSELENKWKVIINAHGLNRLGE